MTPSFTKRCTLTLAAIALALCAGAHIPVSAQTLAPVGAGPRPCALCDRTTPIEGAAATALFSRDVEGAYLCPIAVVQRSPQHCPPYGPGTRQARIAFLSERLPDPLPDLPVDPLPAPEGSVTGYVYGQIVDLPAPTYRHPAEAEAGLPPLRVFLSNINWASVAGTVEYNGQTWVQINRDEYVLADHVAFPEPSRFQGIALAEQPPYPFAWLRWDVNPSPEPGAQPSTDVTLPRRALVTVFAAEEIGGHRWDMVAPGQWIDHDTVSQVSVSPRPAECPQVPSGSK